MASNPRIDDLRKRLERDPGSRLFAQLAEELRKNGDLEDAVRVAREGLLKHPAYASARTTLGRALLDQGDAAAAKPEFEEVLKGAPDNILASRYLGECLEAEGDHLGALARYQQTLLLSPGDPAVEARRRAVEEHLAEASRVKTVLIVGETPIPVSEAEEEMEVELGHEAQGKLLGGSRPPASAVETPIPLAQVEEEFEIERSYEAPASRWQSGTEVGAGWAGEATFEFEEPEAEAQPAPPEAAGAAEAQPSPGPAGSAPPSPAVQGQAGELTSPTLAELYFSQGFPERALEVYRQLLEGDPGNERLQARADEIGNLLRRSEPSPAVNAGPADPRAARRAAVERTIVKLERFLAATRREAR